MEILNGLSDSDVLSLAVVLLLALGAALWRVASLRSDMREKWHQRVDIAYGGLADLAVSQLQELREGINDLIPARGRFDPRVVTVDPGQLVTNASQFGKTIRTRDRLRRRYSWLLRLGPYLLVVNAGLFLVVSGLAISLLGLFEWSFIQSWGIPIICVGFVAEILGLAMYVFLHHALSAAELLVDKYSHHD